MLKKFLFFSFIISSIFSFSQVRNCGTMEHLEYLQSQDPMLKMRMAKNEQILQNWIQNQPESFTSNIITIPVVVHVVYYNSNENISTAQIQSQIDVLNEDFRRLNADASNTPSAFQTVAADCQIEFCLATTDPNGNSTDGITRTQTNQSSFSTNNGVKYSSSGGKDAWNTSDYLNIWVCDISGGILGYAQFPGGNASSDGIVCDYAYFGTIGTATAPFNLGRTTTHEVGHWLNLRHIWGDSNCGNDYCNDTPTQQSSNYGCPSFPSSSNCSGNGSNGDMFMNYMDYTNDNCMNMFSEDQKTRMIAAINTYRSGLLTSNGCQGSGLGCTNPSAFNYDPNATIDDGSCCYVSGCTDPVAINFNSSACFDDGSCIQPINGCTDPLANNYDPSANVDDGSCCYGDLITIDITTDNYPTETSWQLINQSGVVVASINSGDLTQANSSYSWSICPSSTDCYDFIIYDTYGDGICCSYGNGSYSVSYNGNIVASGGSFGTSETNSSIGSCIVPIVGCMNPSASNYDPLANTSTSFGGIFDPNGGSGAYFNGNRHLLVDANVPAKIVSADVYSNSSSNTITFELRDNTSSVIDDTTLTLVQGQQRINLNFDIPVGNNYELGISSSNTSPGLYRSNDAAFVNYPYDIGGLISITESSASVADQYYYYFYNIEVEAMCVGLTTPILGCTNPAACNYNPSANTDDGSCLTNYGCTDPTAFNYDPTATCDDGSCIAIVYGCTDPTACNYNPSANTDDGSCLTDYGCTDPTAFNYDPTATCDDGSCIAIVYGCTDPTAINYFPGANVNDPNNPCCFVAGCTDPTATNYDATACFDDGSCSYTSACNATPVTGVFVDQIIHNRATFNWDNMNSSTCQVDQMVIRYREVGTSGWTNKFLGNPVGSTTYYGTSKRVINLTPSTQYEYQFKIWYVGVSSPVNWGANPSGTFTTLDECPNVGNFAVSTPLTTRATFTWDDSNGAYSFVRIKLRVDSISNPSASDWQNAGGFGINYGTWTRNKNGLTPGETYRGQSKTWCDPAGGPYKASSWTPLVFWTQPTSIRLDGESVIANLDVYLIHQEIFSMYRLRVKRLRTLQLK